MILKNNFKFSKIFIGVAVVLVVAGCSSNDPAATSRQAKTTIVSVMDPYAINCTVKDATGNTATVIDATNSPGRYRFISTSNIGVITATNCIDAATNKVLPTFKAPAPTTSDKSVVTPITTVITEMMSGGLSASQAETAISLDFPGTDLLTFDPLACLDICLKTAIKAQSFSNQMTASMVIMQAAVEDNTAVVTALANAYASGSAVNLNDATSMTAIANAAGVPTNVSGNIADAISKVNYQIYLAADTITSGSTLEAMTVALTRMTAGVIVASDLVIEVEAAVVDDVATDLDSSILNLSILLDNAETEVIEAGLTSVPVTNEN